MSDEPKPSDDRNGCFLDKSWCCKVCNGEIPDGHLDHCDIWQLEKKHRDFIANDYNAVLIARDSLTADLARVTAERDESDAVLDRLARLLAESAVALRGPEPPLTRWSYADVPERIAALQSRLTAVEAERDRARETDSSVGASLPANHKT